MPFFSWNKGYYFGGLFWPTVLIILGVILLLGNLGLIPDDIWKYWPILLIFWGINILLRRAAWSSNKKSFFDTSVNPVFDSEVAQTRGEQRSKGEGEIEEEKKQ